MSENNREKPLSMTAIEPHLLLQMLRKSGCPAAALSQIEDDFNDGAPQNADGTVNLIHYTAWLIQMLAARRQE